MYLYGLYIGLSATFLSYLYLKVIPVYVHYIQQGQVADEGLWWQAVSAAYNHELLLSAPRFLGMTLCFAAVLIAGVHYQWWWPDQPLANLILGSIWFGTLALLARIDRLCFLLPDVLTQLLLWTGLLTAVWHPEGQLAAAVLAAVGVYVVGRILNKIAEFVIKQPLLGLGDVKLLAAVAVWLGWQLIPLLFLLACLLCIGLEGWRQRRWRVSGYCAFGPYIVWATLGVWLAPAPWVEFLGV